MENKTRQNTGGALYVYDRICSKESKRRELYTQYGVRRYSTVEKNTAGRPNTAKANENRRTMNTIRPEARRPMNDGRTVEFRRPPRASGGAQSRAEAANYAAYGKNTGCRPNYKSAETHRSKPNAHAYTYRPGRPTGGAEAVHERPFKLLIDQLVDMFESVSERGARDEMLAKRQAIARKKLSEHRHTILTAILLLLVAAAFVFVVYKQFFVISAIGVDGAELYASDAVIAASGIRDGDNLYSFSVTDAESSITFKCPYIKSAEISRTVPNTVAIAVEEDTAAYVAEIYGDRLLLSAGLRVLGYADEAEELPELKLPEVSYSVAGRVITFADRTDERYVREVLGVIGSSAYFANGGLDKIDLSNEYAITMNVSGKYILKLGGEDDFALKLRMAEKTMSDTKFDKNTPAYIDLTKVGEASVRYDHKLSFD